MYTPRLAVPRPSKPSTRPHRSSPAPSATPPPAPTPPNSPILIVPDSPPCIPPLCSLLISSQHRRSLKRRCARRHAGPETRSPGFSWRLAVGRGWTSAESRSASSAAPAAPAAKEVAEGAREATVGGERDGEEAVEDEEEHGEGDEVGEVCRPRSEKIRGGERGRTEGGKRGNREVRRGL